MWRVDIENIAGIRQCKTDIDTDVNVVQASNFRGKSSYIAAIQTVMGTAGWGDQSYPLTEGMDSGGVILETGDETYNTELKRTDQSVTLEGEFYLTSDENIACARLFAFLDDANPIRSAVRNDNPDKLTELLQKPLDIENIEERISSLQADRHQLKQQFEAAKQAKARISKLESSIQTHQESVDKLQDDREGLEKERSDNDDQRELADRLKEKSNKLDRVNSEIDRLERTISSYETELDSVEEQLSTFQFVESPETTIDIEKYESQAQSLNATIDLLRDVYRINQQVLETEEDLASVTNVSHGVKNDQIECWICGDEASLSEFKEQISLISERREELERERNELLREVREYTNKVEEHEESKQEQARLERRRKELQSQIGERESNLQDVRERQATLKEEVGTLEDDFEEVSEEHDKKIHELEREIGRNQNAIESKQREISQLEQDTADLDSLEEDIDSTEDQIEMLRGRRDQKQRELKERFDEAMDEVIDQFAPGFLSGYLNRKTAADGSLSGFEIRLSREVEGIVHEVALDQLSEGERELIGIVTALAGYRTYNVREQVPLILLDGISELSADNLRSLIAHLSKETDRIITTAYPEAGSFEGNTIRPEEWELVNHTN